MKTSRLLAMAAVAAVLPLQAARADTKSWTTNCYPSQLWTCFSASLTTSAQGTGTHVVLSVRNESSAAPDGAASWLTALGFAAPSNIGVSANVIPTVGTTGTVGKVGAPQSLWSFSQNASFGFGHFSYLTTTSSPDPKTGAIIGCGTPAPGSKYFETCAPNTGFVTFTFNTSGAWSANDAVLLAKWQTNNGSFECATNPGRTGETTCSSTVTPEPISMLLLSTGLLGLGGVVFVRRRLS